MTDEEIIASLKQSRLFNAKLVNDLINNIHFLNEKQKQGLIQWLKLEKQICLNYLKSLKEAKNIKFENIKQNLDNLIKQKIKILELEDKENENYELAWILQSLETI